jgi:hypothetical protein
MSLLARFAFVVVGQKLLAGYLSYNVVGGSLIHRSIFGLSANIVNFVILCISHNIKL